MVGLECCALQTQAQIACQRRPLAHREHPCFFQGKVHHGCNITGCKNAGVGHGLQGVGHLDKAVGIERQTGVFEPSAPTRAGDPDDLVGIDPYARCCLQPPFGYLGDGCVAVNLHTAFGQYRVKGVPHARVVGGQDVGVIGEQVKRQIIGVAPPRAQLVAQAVLHGQQQFHTTRACAHHGHRGCAYMLLHPV